jgi:hypothetical protein
LAVASLVLSLLWIGGLGSLLAIFFAVAARQHLRESGPWEGGEKLALAGLILGIVGLVGTAALFGLIVNLGPTDNSPFTSITVPPIKADPLRMVAVVHYGQRVPIRPDPNASVSHIASVTVVSLTVPATSQVPYVQPAPGHGLAIAQVQVCAGPGGVNVSLYPLGVYLLGQGQPVGDPVGDAQTPALRQISSIEPNQCTTGYQTFDLVNGTTPSGVVFTDGDPIQSYEWTS